MLRILNLAYQTVAEEGNIKIQRGKEERVTEKVRKKKTIETK